MFGNGLEINYCAALIHIELIGRQLDDDEYLIDCGYDLPGTTQLKIIWVFEQ